MKTEINNKIGEHVKQNLKSFYKFYKVFLEKLVRIFLHNQNISSGLLTWHESKLVKIIKCLTH